jgi:putative salt-induced outer membrane protein YdiY
MKCSPIIKWFSLAILTVPIFSAQAQTPAITNAPPPVKWISDVSAGVTLTRGNSDTTLATLTANTDRKTEENECILGANATYGKAKVTAGGTTVNSVTAQNADAFLQYNQLLNDRLYVYARIEGYHDDIADIHYRVTVGPGMGYYFIKQTNVDFSAEAGPAYISEHLGNQQLDFGTLRVSEKFHWQLSDRARVWETAEIDPDVGDIKNYIVTSEIGVEADLTAAKNLSLQVYWDDSFNSRPVPGRQRNDAKFVAALDYKF